jgi:hypothetical protein
MKTNPLSRSFAGLLIIAAPLTSPLSGRSQSSRSHETASAMTLQVVEVQQSRERAAASGHPRLVTLRPSMLASSIEEVAGLDVRMLNARVVRVFGPNAFVIEPATRYEEVKGWRDRILVLIDSGKLRVQDDAVVASIVNVTGVARTLAGVQVSAEVAWPAELNRDLVGQLEVRAAVLATSVATPDGIELTDRGGLQKR